MNTSIKLGLLTLATAGLLSACGREEGRSVGQQVDNGAARVEQGAEQAKDAAVAAAKNIGDKAKDGSITAAVKTELARDNTLKALDINVDTVDGKVILRGTAPDDNAKDRATTLANSVSGVLGVDNQLTVGSRG